MSGGKAQAADFRPILAAIEAGLATRGNAVYCVESVSTPYRADDIAEIKGPDGSAIAAEASTTKTLTQPRHRHTQFILTDNEFRSPVIRGRVLSMLQQTVTGPIYRWRLERWHNAENTSAKPDGTGLAVGMHWTLALTYASETGGCGCRMPLTTAAAPAGST